jgi:hypothetical protein
MESNPPEIMAAALRCFTCVIDSPTSKKWYFIDITAHCES